MIILTTLTKTYKKIEKLLSVITFKSIFIVNVAEFVDFQANLIILNYNILKLSYSLVPTYKRFTHAELTE